MAKKTIMLVCAAGMSTSLLVSKMQKAAKDEEISAKIFAAAASDTDNQIKKQHPDILMLGPQVRYLEEDYAKKLDIPVRVINMQDYGSMNGEKVFKDALFTLNEQN